MFKKITSIFLISMFIFSSIFLVSNNSVSASTNIDGYKVINPSTTQQFTEKIYLQTTEDGKTQRITKSEYVKLKEIEELKSKVKKEYKDNNENTIVNSESIDSYIPVENNENNKKEEAPTAKAATVSYVEVNSSISYNQAKGTIDLSSKIDKLVGIPPTIIISGVNLYSSKSYEGTYSKVTGFTDEWTGLEIKVGTKASKSYKVTSSNWWIAKANTVAGWAGSTTPESEQTQTSPKLTNKKAVLYPVIYNEHSKKYMPVPERANIPVVPLEKRAPWNTTLRGQYIKLYIDTYGNPGWDWKPIDIHHVIPREYGGGNNFSNLYPLPRTMHQNVVNPWWINY